MKTNLKTFLEGKEKEFGKISYSDAQWCGCYEGDLHNHFPKQQAKVISFLSQTAKEAYELGKKYEKVNTGRTKKRCYEDGYKKGWKECLIENKSE